MCISRFQLRLVMAWTELASRRLVTSVMVMSVILMHRVQRVIMMMKMRHRMIIAWTALLAMRIRASFAWVPGETFLCRSLTLASLHR